MKKIKSIKKIIATTLILSMLLTNFGSINVSAAGNMAFSVGCDYGLNQQGGQDIDTTPDALKACDYYAIAGYLSRYTCNPSKTKMRASYNGTKLMESDIVFLSGHGNYELMEFDSQDQGGEYYFYLTYNNYYASHVRFDEFDMSKIKLIVLSGCETAKEYDDLYNLAEKAEVDGARAALGWTTKIDVESSYHWSNRFNNCIALGYTIRGAKNYADSFNYDDNRVKNGYIYGDDSQILKRTSTSSLAATTMMAQDNTIVKTSNTSISINNLSNKATIKQIVKASYPSFFFDDFEIDVSACEENRATVTVVENIGGFRTQNAYVLFYENGKITEIYDRTVKELTVSNISTYSAQAKSINKQTAFAKAAENISNKYAIVSQEGKAMLDVETGEKYYMVYTTISTESGAQSVLSYKYEL